MSSRAYSKPATARHIWFRIDQLARYYEAGMNGTAPKPLSPLQLLGEIMRLARGDESAELLAAAG